MMVLLTPFLPWIFGLFTLGGQWPYLYDVGMFSLMVAIIWGLAVPPMFLVEVNYRSRGDKWFVLGMAVYHYLQFEVLTWLSQS